MGTWFFGKERPTLCTVLYGASTRRKQKEIIFVVEYCTCTRYYSWKRKWKKNTQCKKQVKKQRKNKYEDNNILFSYCTTALHFGWLLFQLAVGHDTRIVFVIFNAVCFYWYFSKYWSTWFFGPARRLCLHYLFHF
jgi:hypothetical protein